MYRYSAPNSNFHRICALNVWYAESNLSLQEILQQECLSDSMLVKYAIQGYYIQNYIVSIFRIQLYQMHTIHLQILFMYAQINKGYSPIFNLQKMSQ